MSKTKMQMKLNIKDCIIIVLKENNIQNLKAFSYNFIQLNDTKKQLKANFNYFLIN